MERNKQKEAEGVENVVLHLGKSKKLKQRETYFEKVRTQMITLRENTSKEVNQKEIV